jgi:hypothetical protein
MRSRLVRLRDRRASADASRPPGGRPKAAPLAQPHPAAVEYDAVEYDAGEYADPGHAGPDESDGDDASPAYWVRGYAGSGDAALGGSRASDGGFPVRDSRGPAYWVPGYAQASEAGQGGVGVGGVAAAAYLDAEYAGPGSSEPADLEPRDLEPAPAAADEVSSGGLITIGLSSRSGRIALAGSGPGVLGGERDLAIRQPRLLAEAGRLALAWATERRLGRSAACGITLALTICSAGWFSAGTRTDIVRGVAALWIGYLVLKAGQRLPAGRSSAAAVDWLTTLGSCLAECVVYAGLAVGAAAEHWSRAWPLAIAVLGLVGVRNLMSMCSVPPGFGEHPEGMVRRVGAAALTMPLGGRVLLIGLVASAWGARVALLALLAWAIVAIGYGLAGRAAPGVTDDDGGASGRSSFLLRLRDDGALARALGALVRGNLLPLPPALLGLVAISALGLLGLHGLPAALMIAPAVVMLLAAPGSAHPHTGRFDWLVPAFLLGAQILYLTAIGRGAGVPGPVIFALAAVLLLRYADLAFPGRPVILARSRLPGRAGGERGTALGWEGRLLIAGLAAAVGLATFAYLALTVYFGFLICAKVVTSFVARQEELARDRLGDGRRRKPSAAS